MSRIDASLRAPSAEVRALEATLSELAPTGSSVPETASSPEALRLASLPPVELVAHGTSGASIAPAAMATAARVAAHLGVLQTESARHALHALASRLGPERTAELATRIEHARVLVDCVEALTSLAREANAARGLLRRA